MADFAWSPSPRPSGAHRRCAKPLAKRFAATIACTLGMAWLVSRSSPPGVANAPPSSMRIKPPSQLASNTKPTVSFTPHFLHSYTLEIGARRLLVDPVLIGAWAPGPHLLLRVRPGRDALSSVCSPGEVFQNYDAVVLTQGLDDHAHPPTLRHIDRRTKIIANRQAAEVARGLGFEDVVALAPGDDLHLGENLRISAKLGQPLVTPSAPPENVWIFSDTRPGGLSLAAEPHGNFPQRSFDVPVDALIMPTIDFQIAKMSFLNGVEQATQVLKALQPDLRYVILQQPSSNKLEGWLHYLLKAEVGDFSSKLEEAVKQTPLLKNLNILKYGGQKPIRID